MTGRLRSVFITKNIRVDVDQIQPEYRLYRLESGNHIEDRLTRYGLRVALQEQGMSLDVAHAVVAELDQEIR